MKYPQLNGQDYNANYLGDDEQRRMDAGNKSVADLAIERIRAKRVIKNPNSYSRVSRKTSPHEKCFTYRMGYQMAVACLVPKNQEVYSRFTGSSLNTKPRAKKNPRVQEIPFPISAENDVNSGTNQIPDLLPDPFVKYKYHERVSQARRRKNLSLHFLSKRTAGKIRDKSTALFRASRKEKIFCTLTFIQRCSDKKAVEILNKFLTVIRAESKNLQYLWVAERQMENYKYPGNIHFHLIINRRLKIDRFNALWVQQQYNAGLRYGFITQDEINSRVVDGTMQEILNPVDVKKIHTIGRLSYYLTKYITKGNNGEASGGFECAAWHCSRGVSRIFRSCVVGRSTFALTESFINTRVNKETGELFTGIPKRKDDEDKNGRLYLMRWIVNKPYFLQFMREMETLNSWILSGAAIGRDCMESISISNEDFRVNFLNDEKQDNVSLLFN